jgi:hypothetical protein
MVLLSSQNILIRTIFESKKNKHVQMELKKLKNTVKNIKPFFDKPYCLNNQESSGEFLSYLLTMFDVYIAKNFVFLSDGEIRIESCLPIITIPPYEIGQPLILRKFKSDAVVFFARRKNQNKTNHSPIIPLETIEHLHLKAIICLNHSHYTCYLLLKSAWYHYNDKTSITYVGSYSRLLKTNCQTSGELYFYWM